MWSGFFSPWQMSFLDTVVFSLPQQNLLGTFLFAPYKPYHDGGGDILYIQLYFRSLLPRVSVNTKATRVLQ